MDEHVAAPAVLNGGPRVPDAVLESGEFFRDREIVIPGDLCKHRLHNCFIRPGFAERPHVFQVTRGESFHVRERSLEVCRQTVDHFRAPVFPFLPVEDVAADLPIEQDQFPVDGHRRTKLRRPNPSL